MPVNRNSVDSHLVSKKHTEAEMKSFVRETSSQKGYRQLAVKNQKAQTSLGHSEMKIAVESRLATQRRTKEQRALEEQLQALSLEKERIALSRLRDHQVSRQSARTPVSVCEEEEQDVVGNPYPVSLSAASRADSADSPGAAYLRMRGGRRRQSREFEDLDLNTATGALLPGLRRSASRGSMTSLTSERRAPSSQNLTRHQERAWMGRPEAISSVRRPRKTIEQQQRDAILIRVSSNEKLSREPRAGVTSSRGPLKATPLVTSASDVGKSSVVTKKKVTKGTSSKKTVSK